MDIFFGETPETLHLIQKEDGKVIQSYSYDYIYALDKEDLQVLITEIEGKMKEEKADLICTCHPQKQIPMIIARLNGSLHIKTMRNRKKDHITGCNFQATTSSKYHENWKEEKMEDGTHVHVRFDNTNYAIPSKQKKECEKPEEVEEVTPRKKRGFHTFNPITLRRFFVRWLLSRWKVKIKFNNGKYPDQKTLFLSMGATASRITFQRNHSISEVFYSGKDLDTEKNITLYDWINKVKREHGLRTLCLMNYVSHEHLENGITKLLLHDPRFPKTILHFQCSTELWEANMLSIGHMEPPYFVGGWVQRESTLEFVELAVIPISDHGVYVESSYERQLYNHLHQQKRSVQKIFDATEYSSWQGYLPDGLLLDTEPPTVLEVFGMSESSIEYHERKDRKISVFTQLKRMGRYGFWYWQAYKKYPMPLLPPASQT